MFVPALSHHHIILDVCPSPEPIPVLQQACKAGYFWSRFMGKRPSWCWEHEQRENTAKRLERHHKRRETSTKSRSCPDTLRSVYKRFGLCARQRTDSFSPLFSLEKGAHGRLHPGGIQALVDAPASKGSLGAVAGASRLKGTMCLCQGRLH